MTIRSISQPFPIEDTRHTLSIFNAKSGLNIHKNINLISAENADMVFQRSLGLTNKIIKIAHIFEIIRSYLNQPNDSFYIHYLQFVKINFIYRDGKLNPDIDKILSLELHIYESIYSDLQKQFVDYFNLLIKKNIDQASMLALNLFPILEQEKSLVLHDISFGYLMNGQIDQALALTKYIPDQRTQCCVLSEILDVLKVDRLDLAIGHAKYIPDSQIRQQVFDDLFDHACALVDKNKKLSALENLCKALIEIQEIITAISVAKEIPDDKTRIRFFTTLVDVAYYYSENVEEKTSFLHHICKSLIEISDIEQVISVIKKINHEDISTSIFERLLEDAKKISVIHEQSSFLCNICKVLIEISDIDRAIFVANTILDNEMRTKLLTAIQEKANKINDVQT